MVIFKIDKSTNINQVTQKPFDQIHVTPKTEDNHSHIISATEKNKIPSIYHASVI